ncbi:unnamed protein product [Rotaria sp. Silwood1]|nr:unnamed protein product [Rotaria sp. Silwood1]
MPEIGSCTDETCNDELKELYECHCCLRLVCLHHLNGHVEITKQNKQRTDSLRQELNTIVNTLQLIIVEKLSTIKCEQNLIEQAKQILDVSSSSMDELEDIFEKINQTIALNRSDIAEESEISKDNEYSMDINHDFVETITLDDTEESIQDEHVNDKTKKRKRKSCRKIYAKCPLTFDGAYGLTKTNHSIEFCEHKTTRRIELYFHFLYTHQLKKVCAERLIRAVADHKDSRITKLFDENEDVINHSYKVSCPFFHGQVNSLKYNGENVIIPPCQRRFVTFHKLAYHLRLSHKISESLARQIVDDLKKKSDRK